MAERTPTFLEYIADEDHGSKVLALAARARRTLWLGTADIKDLHVNEEPFLALIAHLIGKGVEVRLIHAKEPGRIWQADFERYPILRTGLERVLCPRVHFKLVIVDQSSAYIGSANLTGAGMGLKSARRRNFEAGILTNDPRLVQAAADHFDGVWMGRHCADCGRGEFCGIPIARL